jgi:8-oxo-dGTP pyrophosphatase MutT (NUDIX family)
VNSDVPVIRVAAAVILDARGHMLVVRKRSTAAFMQPGGKIMPGESAVDALHREIAEELGVAVAASSVRPLGRHVADAAHEPGHTVAADSFMVSLAGEPRAAAEIDEIAWVDPADPGDITLAPLTKLLMACGFRTSAPQRSIQTEL